MKPTRKQLIRMFRLYSASLLYHNPFSSELLTDDENDYINEQIIHEVDKLLIDDTTCNTVEEIVKLCLKK
jgi:hypothetical protein